LGYRSSIEEGILGGRGVDVALVKGETSIACEICITTGDEHEHGNVRKCLAAGFKYMAVVTPTTKRLSSLEQAIKPQLSDAERERVRFFLPEDLFTFLQELEVKQLDKENNVKGYKVKTTFRPLNGDDMKYRRDAVSQVVAKALKRINDRNVGKK
jgi:hypothetical protein